MLIKESDLGDNYFEDYHKTIGVSPEEMANIIVDDNKIASEVRRLASGNLTEDLKILCINYSNKMVFGSSLENVMPICKYAEY